MKLLFFLFLNILFILGFCGCSSKLVIKTEPADADVFIQQIDSTEAKSIGKSPIEVSDTTIENLLKFSD